MSMYSCYDVRTLDFKTEMCGYYLLELDNDCKSHCRKGTGPCESKMIFAIL